MSKLRTLIKETQSTLKTLGFDPKGIDGIWGNNSEKAFQALLEDAKKTNKITWGQRISVDDIKAMDKMIKDMGIRAHVNDLMACMAFESGGTFKPSTQNKITRATGPIQIMPVNAIAYGTTVEALSKMSFQQYLKYVAMHFKPYAKRIQGHQDFYMSILWPRAVGQPDNYPLWTIGSKAYSQNDALDLNKDGAVTKGEALHYIKNRMVLGFMPDKVRII